MRVPLFLFFFLFFAHLSYAEEFTAVIHVHSTISSGAEPPEIIARKAAALGIDAVFMTDLLHEHYEYGIVPLQGILKKSFERPSILRFGTARYLKMLQVAGEQHGVLMIDGTAVTPHYYWTGSPWAGTLTLHDRAKDLLVLGAGTPEAYENLPLPGRGARSSPYEGPQQERPYQDVIDTGTRQEGLVFWSHPLAAEQYRFENIFLGMDIQLQTTPYPLAMRDTDGYTGIGAYSVELARIHVPEEKASAAIGGIWDQILMDYCQGSRKTPAWLAGEVDYNGVPGENNDLTAVLNILRVREDSREEALRALRDGSFYVVIPERSRRLRLSHFSAGDSLSENEADSGKTLSLRGEPVLRIAADFTDGSRGSARLTIIRNDQMIHDETEQIPLTAEFPDHKSLLGKKNYYRIILQADTGSTLVSNPVFIKKELRA